MGVYLMEKVINLNVLWGFLANKQMVSPIFFLNFTLMFCVLWI